MSQAINTLQQPTKIPESIDIFEVPEHNRTYNMLLMGMPGIGKTTLACQAPQPVVLLDLEKGSQGLVAASTMFPEVRKTDVRRPASVAEVEKMFWEIRSGRIECKTLVLDTVTEFQAMHLQEIRAARNEDTNTLPEYNTNLNIIRKYLMMFRDLPINFVMIAHVIQEDDEIEGKVIRPDLSPKLASLVRSLTDMIGYLQIERKMKPGGKPGEFIESRVLTCTPSKKVWTKNRLGIKDSIVDPTWKKITAQGACE